MKRIAAVADIHIRVDELPVILSWNNSLNFNNLDKNFYKGRLPQIIWVFNDGAINKLNITIT